MTNSAQGAGAPILLAFSGGLDTSFCVPWLRETYGRAGVYGEAAGEWTAEDARGFSKMLSLPGVFWTRAGREDRST